MCIRMSDIQCVTFALSASQSRINLRNTGNTNIFYDKIMSSADIFQIYIFSKNSFRNTIRVSNSLDPDQARQNVGPDMGPNCLQKLSADDNKITLNIAMCIAMRGIQCVTFA